MGNAIVAACLIAAVAGAIWMLRRGDACSCSKCSRCGGEISCRHRSSDAQETMHRP